MRAREFIAETRYLEIEFVCVNKDVSGSTSSDAQDALFKKLKKIPGIVAYRQDFDHDEKIYSGGKSLAVVVVKGGNATAQKVKKLANNHGVHVDVTNRRDDRFIDGLYREEDPTVTDWFDTSMSINEDQEGDEVQSFLTSLSSDDVGVEDIGQYRIYYEGFSDWCQQDALERCNLSSDDPRYLDKYEDIYDEVLQDFINREGGKKPKDSGLTGEEGYPVFYAIFDKELAEMALPSDWDPTAFGHDKTFKSRIEYAKDRASKLGGGSSRIAFVIPDNGRDTVIKVAKNAKGIAQNAAEVDILTDGYISKLDIVIPLIDYDKENPQPTWLQTEKAEKASEQKLAAMMKSNKHLFYLTGYAEYLLGNKGWSTEYGLDHYKTLSSHDKEIFSHYAGELADLVSSSTVLMGDFSRASNWGIYNGRPVLIDLGYTDAVAPLYRK